MKSPHLNTAAAKGGAARHRLHGNPGTTEGRRLGGLRSLNTHKELGTKFKTLQKVRKPRYSAHLAELLGILMGDGHLATYQVSVSTSSETDFEHAQFVAKLFTTLFRLTPSVKKRANKNVLSIVLSSRRSCDILFDCGMPRGNKLSKGLHPPSWILNSPPYCVAFLRGLIDTDGCVYEDEHTIKGKLYSSTCIAFTSASPELLNFVEEQMLLTGLTPSRWGRHVRLRRKKDVLQYARDIGFNNPKHARKIRV